MNPGTSKHGVPTPAGHHYTAPCLGSISAMLNEWVNETKPLRARTSWALGFINAVSRWLSHERLWSSPLCACPSLPSPR